MSFRFARIPNLEKLFDLSDSNDQRPDASSHLLLPWTPRRLSIPRAEQGRYGGEGRVRPPLASCARCCRLKTHPAAPLRCRDGDTPLNHAFGDGFENRDNRGDTVAYLRSRGAPL